MPLDPDPETARLRDFTDCTGRRYPRPFRWSTFFQAVPQMREEFDREVPGEFWNIDVAEDGLTSIAMIACPCGESPQVEILRMNECDCGRFYLNTGRTVRVCRPESVEPGLPTR